MPALGKRINIFVDAVQEEYLLRRAAILQVERRHRLSPSQYVLELIDADMRKNGQLTTQEGALPSERPRLRLPNP